MNKTESAEWWNRILSTPLPKDPKPEGVADTMARVASELKGRTV